MRSYELTVIINPDVSDEDVPQVMEKLAGFIAKDGGTVMETNHWGRRRLAYPIEHHDAGNYVVMQVGFEPDSTDNLSVSLNHSEEFLRHLLIRLDD